MYCKHCGAEMVENSRYCYKCGYDRMSENYVKKEIIEDNIIRIKIKPEFVLPYNILSMLSRVIIYILILCPALFDNLEILFDNYIPIIIILTIMLLYVAIKVFLEKKQYDNLEYNFYATKVEYKDGFLNKEEKELKYKHIREITMRQNILERMFGIGTIRIITNVSNSYLYSSSHNNMRVKNGIFIHCVKNVQQQYKTIKQIIDEGTND